MPYLRTYSVENTHKTIVPAINGSLLSSSSKSIVSNCITQFIRHWTRINLVSLDLALRAHLKYNIFDDIYIWQHEMHILQRLGDILNNCTFINMMYVCICQEFTSQSVLLCPVVLFIQVIMWLMCHQSDLMSYHRHTHLQRLVRCP